MNYDARVTLYGGAAIALTMFAVGALTTPLLSLTGIAFIGPILLFSALFDHLSPV